MKKYAYHHGGRLDSIYRKAGKAAKKEDCVLRALALALDIPYSEIWEMKMPLGYDDDMVLAEIAKNKNIKIERIQTIKKGQKKKLVSGDMPKVGRYILRQANHWVALIDGTLLDTFDSSHRAIYYAWKIIK